MTEKSRQTRTKESEINSDSLLIEKWFKTHKWSDKIQRAFDRGENCKHKPKNYELSFSDMNDGRVDVGSASLKWCPECGGTPTSEAVKTLKQILRIPTGGMVSKTDIDNSAHSFCEALAGAAEVSLIISGPKLNYSTQVGMHFLPRPETKNNPDVVNTEWFGMALKSEAKELLRNEKS